MVIQLPKATMPPALFVRCLPKENNDYYSQTVVFLLSFYVLFFISKSCFGDLLLKEMKSVDFPCMQAH